MPALSAPAPAARPASAGSTSGVRPLEDRDLERVAHIFLKTFRQERSEARKSAPNQDLIDYMRSLYLTGPDLKPGGGSLVHVDASGTVTGFLGGLQWSLDLAGEALTARALSAYMVENPAADPIAGLALMRAYLNGPHDLYFSDTANPTSSGIARLLKFEVMTAHSLEWVRVFKPAQLALHKARRRWSLLPSALLRPPASLADRLAQRLMPRPAAVKPGSASAVSVPVDREVMAALLPKFSTRYRLRPSWPRADTLWYLSQAEQKRGNGLLNYRLVRDEAGTEIGCYLFYGAANGIAQVVQILAADGRLATVLSTLMEEVRTLGCLAVRGQGSPDLLPELFAEPGVFYHCAGAAMVRARRPEILAALRDNAMLAGGLFGDRWTRLASDLF